MGMDFKWQWSSYLFILIELICFVNPVFSSSTQVNAQSTTLN